MDLDATTTVESQNGSTDRQYTAAGLKGKAVLAKWRDERRAQGLPIREGGTNPLTRIARKALVDVFNRLGGVDGLERWAKKHPGQFYTLFVKSAPREREANSLGTGIVINVGASPELRPVIEVQSADQHSE